MNALILHPTASTPVPVTICPPAKARKPRKAKAKAQWSDFTVAELRAACVSRGVKVTTKHVKAELIAMAQTGIYIRPAALDRQAAKRKAAKA